VHAKFDAGLLMLCIPLTQAPSWRDLYLSATQPRASALARPRVVGAVTRRPVGGSAAGGGAGRVLAASGDAARHADAAAATLLGVGTAAAAEGGGGPGVAAHAPAAAAVGVADGRSPAPEQTQQRAVAPPDVGRKRNRKASAPRRCACLSLQELCRAFCSTACLTRITLYIQLSTPAV